MSFDQPDCHTSESCYHKTHADTAWASQDTRRHRLGVRGQRKRRFASAARQRQDLRQKPERRFASETRDICVRGQRGLRQITEREFASKREHLDAKPAGRREHLDAKPAGRRVKFLIELPSVCFCV